MKHAIFLTLSALVFISFTILGAIFWDNADSAFGFGFSFLFFFWFYQLYKHFRTI